jgi:hypothetical protein
MARRKKVGKVRTRTVYKKATRRKSKKENVQALIMGSLAYGAMRQKASNALSPITSKVPLGDIADEVVMAGLSYLAMKKGKGIIKNIGKAGLTIESARIGEALINGGFNFGNVAKSSTIPAY